MTGQPLALTPEALDQAAEVTPVDVLVARNLWTQHAPPVFADLLDAHVKMVEFAGNDNTMGGM